MSGERARRDRGGEEVMDGERVVEKSSEGRGARMSHNTNDKKNRKACSLF